MHYSHLVGMGEHVRKPEAEAPDAQQGSDPNDDDDGAALGVSPESTPRFYVDGFRIVIGPTKPRVQIRAALTVSGVAASNPVMRTARSLVSVLP